jgi:hypothetical protein
VEILGLAEEESREASCWKQENRAKLDEITKGGGVRERGGGISTRKLTEESLFSVCFGKEGKKNPIKITPEKPTT